MKKLSIWSESFDLQLRHTPTMGHDDILTVHFTKKDHAKFMSYITKRHRKFVWAELTDSLDKAWYKITIDIIRKLQPKFMEEYEDVEVELMYHEAAVLNRMVKIIQIEIGEENDDQQFFQSIASELFKIL